MKTRKAFPILGLCLFCSTAVIADQTIPGNLIVQQDSWLYGVTTFGHLAENLQLPGLWLSVNQDEWTTTQTNVTTPGYWGTNTVVVEDWGNVDNGYWTPTYGTVTVPDYYPAVYDSEGNLVSEGYWSSHEEWQQTGQYWNSSPMWAVTGTHTESQPTWVPDVVENVEVENYGSPHVKFNASRSDTNYDFIYPSATGGSGLYTAMSIYGGGLSMTSEDTSHNVALTPWSLQHTGRGTDGTDLVAQNTMEETLHSAWRSSAEAGGGTAVVQSIRDYLFDARYDLSKLSP